MTDRPQLWVFAGPNGAGKSTLVARFRMSDRMTIVNPDTIARDLAPDHRDEPAIILQAGRVAMLQRQTLLQTGQSFALETTLTGHSELRIMQEARADSYKITLVFVGLDDALMSLARVRERVAQGGHNVPVPIIMRRYAKSLANLPTAIAPADRSFILDNTGGRHRLLVTIDQGEVRHRSPRMPRWTQAALDTLPNPV